MIWQQMDKWCANGNARDARQPAKAFATSVRNQ